MKNIYNMKRKAYGPEGTFTVEALTIKPYPAGYENTIKVVLEYMGEMDEAVGNTFDELIEFYRKGGGFVEEKVCCIQKAYVNRDLRI
jgi:hypothetical protein